MRFDKFEMIFNIDRSSETLVTLLFLLLKNCIGIREIENSAVHSNDNIYVYNRERMGMELYTWSMYTSRWLSDFEISHSYNNATLYNNVHFIVL